MSLIEGATRALLFTDIVDSTALVERLGDSAAAALWAEHDRVARALLAQLRGREIGRSDGFFLLFDEVADAAAFALAYHDATVALGLSARVGLHHDTVTLRRNPPEAVERGAVPVEVDGLATPLTARVMSLARGGQTLLTAAARRALAAAPPGAAIRSHGYYRAKGIAEPVELYELAPAGCADMPPADGEKVYRVVWIDGLWRPLCEVRHNLALERDAFIGRAAELNRLAQRLEDGARLLTLLGVGGTGKTRLVRRYGLAWLGDWPGGVYFCDLSETRSLEGICFAVAAALEVPLGRNDPVTQLGHAIAGRGRCLVILDNFEQVIDQAAATLGRWLDRAHKAAFAVTSRERLHLPGEEVFPVEPLALATEAIELFEVRARAQVPQFMLDDNARGAVAEVVRLLDGLPLAIELAAARIRIFAPGQLVQRMRDRFQLLAGARGSAARQATLKAAIDWSWELLAPWEQAALAQCSVFEGGFTMESAEAVLDLAPWPAAPGTMDVVQALVDKSLLRVARPQTRLELAAARFGMYLSIHEYAAEQLQRFGARSASSAEARHGAHYAGLGSDEALETLCTHGGVQRLRRLALDLDNLVAACRRAVARADAAIAVATYRAAWEVLGLRGPFAVGVALGAQLLALPGLDAAQRCVALMTAARARRRAGQVDEASAVLDEAFALATESGREPLRAEALCALGTLDITCSRYPSAIARLDEALVCFQALAHRRGEARALTELAGIDFEQGRSERAQERLLHALALSCESGHRREEIIVLNGLGVICAQQGRFDEALRHFEAALRIVEELEEGSSHGQLLCNMGELLADKGRLDEAWARFERSLAIARDIGDRGTEGDALHHLSRVRGVQERWTEAASLCEAALVVFREVRERRMEGIALANLSEDYYHLGRTRQATACASHALAIHRELGNRYGEASLTIQLAQHLLHIGRVAEALEQCQAGEALARQLDAMLLVAMGTWTRGLIEAKLGNGATAQAALAEAETIADELRAGPDSSLQKGIERLRAALT